AAGCSRRARVHEQGAARIRFPGPPADELTAVVVNTAGGMAGGDSFDFAVDVGADARLLVTTAAAEKVYRPLAPETKVGVSLVVRPGARLCWLPQETILFDRARLRRSVDVDLQDDAQLLLAEAVIFGRGDMGETLTQGLLVDRW